MQNKFYDRIAKILTLWIPITSARKSLRKRLLDYAQSYELARLERKIPTILQRIRLNVQQSKKIRVAFFVVYDSSFPAKNIFEIMLHDNLFAPFILVIPDTSRGQENCIATMNKTYQTFLKQYTEKYIQLSYNKTTHEFIDFSAHYDMVCTANPYDSMTHEFYSIARNLCSTLIIYFDYGYAMSNWWFDVDSHRCLQYIYKYFIIDTISAQRFGNKKNIKLMGYPKMDSLSRIQKQARERKKIVIAPHHSVLENVGINFSNFLRYYDFFLELAQKYPEIDFVFRPHPLLLITLKNHHIWTQTQIDAYLQKIESIPNMQYQNGGDYFETFVNSDGIIHDCGSFMAEYLYTGNPACFLLKDEATNEANYNTFAKSCIDVHYKAYDESQIIDFMDKVILEGDDPLKEKRESFFHENLKFHYPHTSQKIVDYFREEFQA